ncbi:MAG: tol-pal system-associated acyl-CoA thioesterase [Parvibaculaceae bacterium]|nr:tol-pal system-associated acyl-CoA thioesterase [Parvibaculaceae bacterium]
MSDASWPDLAGCIVGKVHHLPIRVYYEDTDFTGIVYHANYLKFAERGRTDFLRVAGVHHSELQEADPPLAFAVHKMEIEFLSPARIDDELLVETRYVAARGARFDIEQVILRDGQPIWRAMVRAACIDGAGRPKRMPVSIIDAIGAYVSEPSQSR